MRMLSTIPFTVAPNNYAEYGAFVIDINMDLVVWVDFKEYERLDIKGEKTTLAILNMVGGEQIHVEASAYYSARRGI